MCLIEVNKEKAGKGSQPNADGDNLSTTPSQACAKNPTA